jgi:ABC-2 type transport system permease protein
MHAALSIAVKDLRQKVRDRSAIIIAVVAPLSLAFLFSTALPSSQSTFDATFVVVDLDRGPVAQSLVQGPLAGLAPVGIQVERRTTEAEARAMVDDGSASVAIVIPRGFSDAIQAARAAKLQVIGSATATLATQVARSVLAGFASSVEGVQVAVATVIASSGSAPDPATIGQVTQAALAAPAPITTAQASTGDRLASTPTYYAAAMAVLFLFFAAQFGVVSIHAERRAGTLARMLAAPISSRSVLFGKVLVSLVLGVVSMGIVAVGTTLLVGADWGDPIAVAALILATVIAASGIALLIVGFTKNEEQASGLTAIVAMVLAVLGGSFFPLSQAPEGLAAVSLFTPHAWFLRGVNDLASNEGLAVILPSLVVLTTIGLVTGGLGLLRAGKVVTAR